MKMKPGHYRILKDAISNGPPKTWAEYQAQGLSEMRYRWDLMHYTGQNAWIVDELYPYLDDTHIDTALRQIVRELGLMETPE